MSRPTTRFTVASTTVFGFCSHTFMAGGYRRSVLLGDLVTVSVAVCLALTIEHSRGAGDRSPSGADFGTSVGMAGARLVTARVRAKVLGCGDEEFRRVTRASTYLVAGVAVVSAFFDPRLLTSGLIVAIALLTSVTLVVRCVFRVRLRHARAAGLCAQRTLVVCEATSSSSSPRNAAQMRRDGLIIVAACVPDGRGGRRTAHSFRVAGDFTDIVETARTVSAEVVAVTACGELDVATLRRLRWGLAAEDIDLVLLATLAPMNGRIHARPLSRVRVLHVEEPELRGMRHLVKAVLDRVLSALVAPRAVAGAPGALRLGPSDLSRPGALPTGPDRARRAPVHDAQAPHDGGRGRTASFRPRPSQPSRRQRPVQDQGRPAHDTSRALAATRLP